MKSNAIQATTHELLNTNIDNKTTRVHNLKSGFGKILQCVNDLPL